MRLTSLILLSLRFLTDFFAMSLTHFFLFERKIKRPQESKRFFVRGSRGSDSNIHPPDSINFVVFNFWKYDLFLDAQTVIAAAIKRLGSYTTKVTDTWQGN